MALSLARKAFLDIITPSMFCRTRADLGDATSEYSRVD
jgi:hypothetical protein